MLKKQATKIKLAFGLLSENRRTGQRKKYNGHTILIIINVDYGKRTERVVSSENVDLSIFNVLKTKPVWSTRYSAKSNHLKKNFI